MQEALGVLCKATNAKKHPKEKLGKLPKMKRHPRKSRARTQQPKKSSRRQRSDLWEMNREKISRMEETIRKLKKDYRRLKKSHKLLKKSNCKRRTKALRKKNKKLKRKLEEFETKESGHIYYQEDSDVGAKEMCSKEKEENIPCHPTFSEAVVNSSNKFSLDLYKEVLREKSSIEGGLITSLVDNLFGGDKEERIANLVMSGLAISTVLAFCMISLKKIELLFHYLLSRVCQVCQSQQCWRC